MTDDIVLDRISSLRLDMIIYIWCSAGLEPFGGIPGTPDSGVSSMYAVGVMTDSYPQYESKFEGNEF